MLCKEDVVSWFGSLSSYKRIDLMCTLLNMCLPFEVRYLGTCVEDLGKRDYNDLRDTEHRANNATDLAEVTNLAVTDKRTRRKLALYMALLHSCNYSCAIILFKNLSNFDSQEITNLLNGTTLSQDEQLLEELLLLYIMALNHPAFTYEQKSAFGDIYLKLQEEEAKLNPPKPGATSTYKPGQICMQSCVTQNDRMVDTEITNNCMVPPPPMQTYHGDVSMRSNNIVAGVPPGLSLPPPGICLPSPEQMSMGTGVGAQYFHVGFPSMNHMPPWTTGQVMMGNQIMYHTGDTMTYPASPLVSRQSSPSQSRSPSRSNSPLGRRNSTIPRTSSQITQPTSNTMTTTSTSTSTTTSSCQTNIASANVSSLPPLPTIGTNRTLPSQQPPLLPTRSVPYSRQNSSIDVSSVVTASTILTKQPHPPPRLRPSTSTDLLRETLGKEMPSFKGNLQNYSLDEIRRMSDEDLRDIGLPPNAVGQLRNIVKGQTSNGLNPLTGDKKVESTNSVIHSVVDSLDTNEIGQGVDVPNDSGNSNNKSIPLPEHQTMHNSHTMTNMRRYPTIPPLEHMQMYPAPPPMYAPQTGPCYTCLTFPVPTGIQGRFSRCNPQYCVSNMSSLKLDPENSRHYSQSSSSESSGSRSPPETPPAAPWIGSSGGGGDTGAPPVTDYLSSAPLHSIAVSHPTAQPIQQQQASLPERQRRKNPGGHVMRHKNNQMVNGGGPPSLPHCVSFPTPPSHSQLAYLPHGHFPTLRPSTGMYSNFSHATYARPAYQPTYQPNGEMMYQYPGHPGSGGTPPPAPTAPAPSQQTYMPPAPVVTFTPTAPPAKISCYNCGSSNHLAVDCKDQTMEDLTKRAQYRLDYTITKQPGECPSGDK